MKWLTQTLLFTNKLTSAVYTLIAFVISFKILHKEEKLIKVKIILNRKVDFISTVNCLVKRIWYISNKYTQRHCQS